MRSGAALTTKRRCEGTRGPFPMEALTIAKFEPGIYDVVESFAPPRALDPISWTPSGSID